MECQRQLMLENNNEHRIFGFVVVYECVENGNSCCFLLSRLLKLHGCQ